MENHGTVTAVVEPQYSEYSLKKIKGNIVQDDVVGTITASAMQSFNHDNCHLVVEDTPKVINNLRIRKLTPRECWRLMGVKDEDFDNVSKNQSNSSLYHLAGDSIVTTCLMAIFGELLGIDWKEKFNEKEWWNNERNSNK